MIGISPIQDDGSLIKKLSHCEEWEEYEEHEKMIVELCIYREQGDSYYEG